MTKVNKKVYAFLDTNVLLEFQGYDQIDWPTLLGYKEVCLVFTSQLMSELDYHKISNPNDRKRERAKKILKRLYDLSRAGAAHSEVPIPDRPYVCALILPRRPKSPLPDGLQDKFGDDLIIASIIEFRNEQDTGTPIVLISHDIGMLIKAQTYQIMDIPMNEEYLVDDQSNDQRKSKSSETGTPQPKLVFINGEDSASSIAVQLSLIKDPDTNLIESLVEKERIEISWEPPEPPSIKSTGSTRTDQELISLAMIAASSYSYPKVEIDRYQRQSEKYLEDYKRYLYNLFTINKTSGLLAHINLQVINNGNGAAESAQIHLHTPNELIIARSLYDHIPLPQKPHRPRKPTYSMSAMIDFSDFTSEYLYRSPSKTDEEIIVPTIEQKNSFTLVKWNCEQIMHNIPERLRPIKFIFPGILGTKEYHLDYEIHARNLLKPVTGELIMSVNVSIDDSCVWFPELDDLSEPDLTDEE